MDLTGKYVMVVGCGISGIGAATLLSNAGARPILFDTNDQLNSDSIREKLPKDSGIRIELGSFPKELTKSLALLVLSPGIPLEADFLNEFKDLNIPVWGEVELAFHYAKGTLLAVTGTNGKTTTTSLIGKIMQDYFNSVFIVGNIGNAYTKEALHTTKDSVTIAEISSFQLETIVNFKPHIAAILNITPDHLNRHHTLEQYAAVKKSITKNQTKEDFCVLNYDDPYLREFSKSIPSNVIWFSSSQIPENGYCLEDDTIICVSSQKKRKLIHIKDLHLLGMHNVENVMAAIAVSDAFHVPMDSIIRSVKEFRAVEHRIEYVATKRGVDYYNDSKGTNPDAAIKAVEAMNRKTVLIGGGYDKQSTYDEWIESFGDKIKCLVLIGQTKDKIAECAKKHGFSDIVMAQTLEQAVEICAKTAASGEAVLLSPACASWGMFPNYEVRGQRFKELVMELED